jgi:3-dehydroquinate synthase
MNSQINYLKKFELFKELESFIEGQFFAVVDHHIKNHLPQWIQFSPNVFWLNEPEKKKNLETYADAVDFFLKQGIHRKSTLYAFGGGATTDFAGFVAATILRGISWVSVPTTLLGMIDASIGGKVGINMPQGKNLIGAFHSPEKIYICGDFLSTLPEGEWLSGKGEILKYCFLSKKIFDLVMNKALIEDVAIECAKHKMEIVDRDFKDQGDRILLNLGHTLGHAFESSLKIPHGLAVGMGLRYLFELFKLDDASANWNKLIKQLEIPEEKFNLDKYSNFELKHFLSFLDSDKKKIDTKIKMVFVKSIGDCYTEELTLKDLKNKIQLHDKFNPEAR